MKKLNARDPEDQFAHILAGVLEQSGIGNVRSLWGSP